jgi:hypothetical protein
MSTRTSFHRDCTQSLQCLAIFWRISVSRDVRHLTFNPCTHFARSLYRFQFRDQKEIAVRQVWRLMWWVTNDMLCVAKNSLQSEIVFLSVVGWILPRVSSTHYRELQQFVMCRQEIQTYACAWRIVSAMANTSTSRFNRVIHSQQGEGRALKIRVYSSDVFWSVSRTPAHAVSSGRADRSQDNLRAC